jgi:cell division protein FtsL
MVLAAGLLDDTSRDVIAILGAVGVVLTAIGVLLAWWQMRKTTSANQAATKAALAAVNESRASYHRHVVAQMSRLLSESIVCMNGERWELAAMRLRDLADLITETSSGDDEWMNLASDVHTMEHALTRISRGEIQYSRSLATKWHKLHQTLRTHITADLIPFPGSNEEGDGRNKRSI